ncbi:expressed unknown protein [Ectocarpus siliculosus]|uniref:LNR domain-containing protein n=1 Tax=Ectocarpus siliculosus TaxID=2880 RepID=D7FI78_ECTSI|nr:expressed unknown protein [Ectocarpus siliculosus]|eukprot:CBJ28703.1 expressed unknown protein [Ectocarpus siliculosus]
MFRCPYALQRTMAATAANALASVTVDMLENCEDAADIGDGYCNEDVDTPECGYDGGNCCSCTCQSAPGDDIFSCRGGYRSIDCQDPSASCFGEGTTGGSDDFIFGDDDQSMSYQFVNWEETESLPTVTDAVELGAETEVSVSPTAHDGRSGSSSGEVGCGEVGGLGCTATNTRDGIVSDIESTWSCATHLVPDEGPCPIMFTFAEPQNIVDIQVAFWNDNERVSTLGASLEADFDLKRTKTFRPQVHVNGELTHTH